MTGGGENPVEGNPISSSVGERKFMKHSVVKSLSFPFLVAALAREETVSIHELHRRDFPVLDARRYRSDGEIFEIRVRHDFFLFTSSRVKGGLPPTSMA